MPLQFATGRLRIEWSSSDAGDLVVLNGQLDELCELAAFTQRLGKNVTIDLEQVSFVNSIGLREWVRTLRALDQRGAHVTLSRCSEAVVHHMNMILAARGRAAVDSFHMPYHCDFCDRHISVCVSVAEHLDTFRHMQVPEQRCAGCGRAMEMSEMPETYLMFLES